MSVVHLFELASQQARWLSARLRRGGRRNYERIVEMWMFMTSPHREGQDYTPPHQRTPSWARGALGGIRAPQDHLALFIRTIGIAGARVKIGLANLVYNLKRLLFLRTAAA